jgi:hypothetical protein
MDNVMNATIVQIHFHSHLIQFNVTVVIYDSLSSINALWNYHTGSRTRSWSINRMFHTIFKCLKSHIHLNFLYATVAIDTDQMAANIYKFNIISIQKSNYNLCLVHVLSRMVIVNLLM